MTIELKYSTWDDFPYVKTISSRGLTNFNTVDDPIYIAHKNIFPPDRNIMAMDGDKIVGNALSYPMVMNIPGATSKIAAVASVSVQATHRRKGLNRKMMKFQLENIHEREEPLAVLQATESIIYGRYGYGMASFNDTLEIERSHSKFAEPFEPSGQLSFIERDEAKNIFPKIYSRAILGRNGMIERTPEWWEARFDLPSWDNRIETGIWNVKYTKDTELLGYVRFRIDDSTLHVIELMSTNLESYKSLWQFCLQMDLTKNIKAYQRPTDEDLKWILADPRRLNAKSKDQNWVRLVNVQEALSNRKYWIDGSINIKVVDDFLDWNNNTYSISSENGESECIKTNEDPDIILNVRDLGATYLGGINFSVLQKAGRVEEISHNAISQANLMFSTDRAPWGNDLW